MQIVAFPLYPEGRGVLIPKGRLFDIITKGVGAYLGEGVAY